MMYEDDEIITASWNQHYENNTTYLDAYGDSSTDKNNGVTLAYNCISHIDPIFTWFSATTIGSYQVGEALTTVNNPMFSWTDFAKTIDQGFSVINQEIFATTVAAYFIYKEYGIEGLNVLANNDSYKNVVSLDLVFGFQAYEKLEANAYQIALESSLNSGNEIMPNDPAVLELLFSDEINIELAEEGMIKFTAHEQQMVDHFYSESFSSENMTLGDAIHCNSFTNKIVNAFHWGGPTFNGHYFSTTDYDWSDYNERMLYFDGIFKEISKIIIDDPSMNMLGGITGGYADSLGVEFLLDEQIFPASYVPQAGLNRAYTHGLTFANNKLVIDLSNDGLALIHETPDELRKSGLYLNKYEHDGYIEYTNSSLPYLNEHSSFLEDPDGNFVFNTLCGEIRGLTFPLVYDTTSGIPLGVPIHNNQFTSESTIDLLMKQPEIFNQPGDIKYNTALQLADNQQATTVATLNINHVLISNVTTRISEFRNFSDLANSTSFDTAIFDSGEHLIDSGVASLVPVGLEHSDDTCWDITGMMNMTWAGPDEVERMIQVEMCLAG